MSETKLEATHMEQCLESKNSYGKLGNAGRKGTDFHINLLVIVLLNSLKKIGTWRLSAENNRAGKFDDIVIEHLNPNVAILIQAKHKETRGISYRDLTSDSSQNDFSLPKYFCSYQEIKEAFVVQNVIICTNTDIDKNVKEVALEQTLSSESPLYLKKQNVTCYSFDESLKELKQSILKYCTKNSINDIDTSDENIRLFLSHLQLVVNFPTGSKLDESLENLIVQIKSSQGLDIKTCIEHIYKKVNSWYSQAKGIYLTPEDGVAFICEARSNKYCNTLKSYDISFKNGERLLRELKDKVLHIISKEHILNAIKVYQALQKEDMTKTLFLNLDENINIQQQMIDTFKMPCYIYIVIICTEISEEINKEMCEKLIAALSSSSYKKLILIADNKNKLVKLLKTRNISVFDMKEKVKFSSVTENYQRKFREMRLILFQGSISTMNRLFPTLTNEELDDIIDQEVLVKFVTNEQIKVGLKLTYLEGDIIFYYVPRTFKRGNTNISEDTLWQHCTGEKIILISDAPGMGKSTILTKLAVSVKENDSNLWIIRVDISNYADILLRFQNNLISLTIEELLDFEEKTRLNSGFERNIFLMQKKIVLLIDGVDEVSPDHKDTLLNLLVDCKKRPNFAKIFMTTRPHLCEELEQKLQVKAWTMEPFTEANQIEFLKNYWVKSLDLIDDLKKEKCDTYAQALLKIFGNTFTRIPLQLKMVADVFQEKGDKLENCESCKDFLISSSSKPKLPNKLELVKLYEIFISKKYDAFIDYYRTRMSNYGKIYEDCKRYHRILALQTILSEEDCKFFYCYKKEDESNIDHEFPLKLGIVQKADGRFSFIHRTFAEYFVAKYLIKRLKSECNNEQFFTFFVTKILRFYQFFTVRQFLNDLLQKELHLLSHQACKGIGRQLNGMKDIILGASAEGSVGILKYLFKCFHTANVEVNINSITVRGRTAIYNAVIAGNLDTIYFLIENGADVNARDEDGGTAFHLAVVRKDVDVLKCLVEIGAEVNIINEEGCTALHIASLLDKLNMLQCLVENGAEINIKNEKGYAPLHNAAAFGNIETVKYLVKKGAKINSKSNDGQTPLHEAAKLGRSDIVKYLIENGAIVTSKTENGRTVLHEAVAKYDLGTVKYLVENGAQVNSIADDGRTAIHEVATLKIAKYLIENGAEVNTKDKFGYSAFYKAIRTGKLGIVKYFTKNGAEINSRAADDRTALHEAALYGYLDIVEFLVENGAYVNSRQLNGQTPLQEAVTRCHLDVVMYLVENGAEVNNKAVNGRRALHKAAALGGLSTVKYLVENNANINQKDNYGRTALYEAATRSNLDIIKYLVDNGSKINSRAEDGCTALHKVAARHDSVKVLYLLKNGAEANIQDEDGNTPLHIACAWGNIKSVRYLLTYGALINKTAKDGSTALHVAAGRGRLDVVKHLMRHGADVTCKTKNGRTILHEAAAKGSVDTVKYLVENGTPVNNRTKDGKTALLEALEKQHQAVVNYLTEETTAGQRWLDTTVWYVRKLQKTVFLRN